MIGAVVVRRCGQRGCPEVVVVAGAEQGAGTEVGARVEELSRLEVGRCGERIAEAHLVAAGARVLDRNWRCRLGELDLVVLDGDVVVGVEVRTRRTTSAGTPLESVTPRKVARLRRLLGAWCAEHPAAGRGGCGGRLRLDVVGVLLAEGTTPEVQHVRGIDR
ncbi:putative endonuclease [Quadrisphaera granulorum]|uniref:UPF0102 protein BXY45_101382 n=1 Tax=Quadrisphaera granulorum TaxID=317664 RepID=A0A316AHJ0_9ACTN|nr:YraN family protein [Quadrisphaera granulorum]PWJ56404.1 putative endonuclease [Quadrisphaera granulorum]SZE95038.1 putative endonuclease [Quadrisphaera granulorum]